ncbi:hypothetical protein SAMN02745161_2832 [Halodesulfovibrio marinisediminis DSM 17456]|uniref:Uncharacterized protein n=1 Tax=Halodesulfovibrio marinisediminis DSM 17456 TaxID=1121457 RepID=A0A1N6IKH3_9BACT|nr:hypothetical protein SAMN02745161_2832 [Halodesulfovibrio marinisediminis DSM 17456]
MTTLQITVLDPDTTQAQITARHLRTILKCEGLSASVQEVTCYLEISRRGLTDKTPVISVNGQNFQCKNLSTTILDQFVLWLSQKLNY